MNFQREQIVNLPGGRRLGYEQAGAPHGTPMFYFHGVPSARTEWKMWGDAALLQSLNIRLIAMDRPGVGSSDFAPQRRLSDWPADVVAVADELGLERFSVLGYSGGGAYAAACAKHIPDRLVNVALVSSIAPFHLPGIVAGIEPANLQFLRLARQRPWLYRLLYKQIGLFAKMAPRQHVQRALSGFGQADREVFARPEVHGAMFASVGTSRGQQVDTALAIGSWGFALSEITTPVHVWHGEEDRNTSVSMFRYLAEGIPDARSHLLPDEGHISLIVNHARTILLALIDEDAARSLPQAPDRRAINTEVSMHA